MDTLERTWDVIVVGAGSAGAVAASRLSEDPDRRVLLLEAGPDYRSADTPPLMQRGHWAAMLDVERFPQFQWTALRGRRTPGREPETYWRGRGVGGSSAINGLVAIRPPLDEFDLWAEQAGPRWAPDAVLDSFIRLEDDLAFGDAPWHGRGGPIPISREALEHWGALDHALRDRALDLGHPWTPDSSEPGATGVSTMAYNARDERRVSTNDGYLEPARDRANLTIRGDVLVDRVRFAGTRATGVMAIVDGHPVHLAGGEIVVSAGAVHSPAILLRSGIGPADDLRAVGVAPVVDLAVGRGFQEHPSVLFQFPIRDGVRPPRNGRHSNAVLRWTSGAPGTLANDMAAMVLGPAPTAPTIGGLGLLVNQPLGRGTLRLVSTDPTVDPAIDMDLAGDERDRARLRTCLARAEELLAADAFTSVMAGPVVGIDGTPLADLVAGLDGDRDRGGDVGIDGGVDGWLDRTVDICAHPSSTCPLGDPARGGVVDAEGRVHGTQGLRIVDLSITPRVPRANTNLTAIMIGEHIAAGMR